MVIVVFLDHTQLLYHIDKEIKRPDKDAHFPYLFQNIGLANIFLSESKPKSGTLPILSKLLKL